MALTNAFANLATEAKQDSQITLLNDPSTTTSFGPITTENTVLFAALDTANDRVIQLQLSGLWEGGISLQASNDGTVWFSASSQSYNADAVLIDTVYSPDLLTIPVVARFFRAITSADFSGTVSGSYAARSQNPPQYLTDTQLVGLDPGLSMPVSGKDPLGNNKSVAVSDLGQIVPADGRNIFGSLSRVGTIWIVETTGYNSIVVQLQGTFSGTITFQVSNDSTTWTACGGWPVAGAASPVSSATAVGQWIFPCLGRYFRCQVTAYTSGNPIAIGVLKNQFAFFPASSPSIAANSSINVAQIGATAVVTGGVAGIQAIGGNIAVGAAPTANPVPIGGWDGTNTRRILTDASSGGVVLGSSTVANGQTLARGNQTATTPAGISIKASAGRLTMITVAQMSTVAGFLHLYNAASLTLGTTTDVHCYALPGTIGNYPISLPDGGLYFSTGIQAAFTAGSGATDNTSFGSAPSLTLNYAFI